MYRGGACLFLKEHIPKEIAPVILVQTTPNLMSLREQSIHEQWHKGERGAALGARTPR